MIGRIVRLTFRMHRFEVGAVVVLGGLLVLGAIFVNWALGNLALPPDCVISFETGELPSSCLEKYEAFQKIASVATPISVLMSIFPVIAGLLLGGPVMAREIERGTTSLAWSMSPSRLRWFLHRVVPMIVLLIVVTYAVGAAAEHLMRALNPRTDLAQSFIGFRFRGVLLASQAFLLASTAIAIGALLGRAVPTLLLSLILGMLSIVAIGQVHQREMLAEAVVVPQDENFFFSNDDLFLDSRFTLPDGRLVTVEELVAIDPTALDLGLNYPTVSLLIRGERYRIVEGREAAAQLAIGLAFLVGAALVIVRRRPT